MKLTHYEWDRWSTNSERATTQERLQEIAGLIRESCKVERIDRNNDEHTCTIYRNDNLGLRYWVHDTFGKISEIIEGREY